jgi:hypothetical protein
MRGGVKLEGQEIESPNTNSADDRVTIVQGIALKTPPQLYTAYQLAQGITL